MFWILVGIFILLFIITYSLNETSRALINILFQVVFIFGALYVLFWIGILFLGLISSNGNKIANLIRTALYVIAFLFFIGYIIYFIQKIATNKSYREGIIKRTTSGWGITIREAVTWKEIKKFIIYFVIVLSAFLLPIVIPILYAIYWDSL